MGKPLRVLIVEDSEDDAVLLLRELKRGGYDVTFERVETAEAMECALKERQWDVIISDYKMPVFDAPSALKVAQDKASDVPFIVVSGSVGEDIAVEVMRSGANDYIMKDNLTRLPAAIGRELHEVEVHRQRERAEENVKTATRQWQTTFDAMADGMFLLSADQRVLMANSAMVEFTGKTVEELVGRYCWEVVHGIGEPLAGCPHVAMMESGKRERMELVSGDRILDVIVDPIFGDDGQPSGSVHIISDITEIKGAEEALQDSEIRFRSIFDTANDGILLANTESKRFEMANDAMCRMLECNHAELRELSVGDIHPEKDLPFVAEQFERQARGEIDIAADIPVKRKDGSVFYADVNASSMTLRDKTYLMGIFRDITERKKAEEEIYALAKFPSENPNPVLRVSEKGIVLYANGASGPLLDTWEAELGRRLGSWWVEIIQETLSLGTSREIEIEAGEKYFVAAFAPVVESRYVNIYAFDITARKEAEEALRRVQSRIAQQERLRALGQMASGIAHDFNNALAPILGFTELSLAHESYFEDKNRMKEYMRTINTAAGDAAEVVRRLRDFYRPESGAGTRRSVDLNALVVEVMSVTEPRWKNEVLAHGSKIDFSADLGELSPVLMNESEIRQVLINLVFNAVDAIQKNGSIVVRTRAENGCAVIEIKDTGVGMSEETLRRCLEPFFTSKGETGTGLGLSIAHGVISRHEGFLDVESEEGKGSTFTIRLPLGVDKDDGTEKRDAAIVPGPLRILVVDDESLVREVTEEYLTGDGHTVVSAGNGAEALETFRSGEFDLVITDMAMPKVGGGELAASIKEISPTMPVILLTGFGEMARDLGEKPLCVDYVVGKPVRIDDLQQVVAKAVAGERERAG